MRAPTLCLFCTALLISACSDKPALSLEERARYQSELAETRSECMPYRDGIARATQSAQALDAAIKAAKAAHCIRPDV